MKKDKSKNYKISTIAIEEAKKNAELQKNRGQIKSDLMLKLGITCRIINRS